MSALTSTEGSGLSVQEVPFSLLPACSNNTWLAKVGKKTSPTIPCTSCPLLTLTARRARGSWNGMHACTWCSMALLPCCGTEAH